MIQKAPEKSCIYCKYGRLCKGGQGTYIRCDCEESEYFAERMEKDEHCPEWEKEKK